MTDPFVVVPDPVVVVGPVVVVEFCRCGGAYRSSAELCSPSAFARAFRRDRKTRSTTRASREDAREDAHRGASARIDSSWINAPWNDARMTRAASRRARALALALALACATVGISSRVLARACAAETARATREVQTMTALRSLGVAPEAWTRATRVDEARGSSRARERVVKKAFRRLALRAHPDKRRGGASEVGDAFEAAAAAYETARETTMTTRRRAMRHRALARTCAMVSRMESFVIDRARGMMTATSRDASAGAPRSDDSEDASTAVRDDDGDEDDSNAKPSNEESFWTRAMRALGEDDDDDEEEEEEEEEVEVEDDERLARSFYPGRRGEREL